MDHLDHMHDLNNTHHQELLHLAQRGRQAGERQPSLRPHHRALAWLGDRLIAWGQSLRERYSTVAPSSAPHPNPKGQQIIDILL